MSTSFAYEQYFGLEEHPFSITPDPRFVYLSDSHRAALEHLEHGATGGVNGFVLLTGDVGTGKTMMCRTFLENLPPKTEVALILNPILTLNEFLQTICDELNLEIEGSRKSNKNLIDQLNRFLLQVYAVGQKTILIVDEAQNLTQELLEQIRLLTNLETSTDKLLQIFLIGQPELRNLLNRPEMLQVSQRITSRFHLGPLNKTETQKYILRRLEVAGAGDIEFIKSGIREIFAFSKGVPRLINVICDKALFCAFEESTNKIDAKIVREAERKVSGNLDTGSGRSGLTKAAMSLGVLVLLSAVLLAAAYFTNVADVRPWVDNRLAAFRGIESAAHLADTPQMPAPTQVTRLPTSESGDQGRLVATETKAPGVPVEDAQTAVDAQATVETSNQAITEVAVIEPVAPETSPAAAEIIPEPAPPPQEQVVQAAQTAEAMDLESAKVEAPVTPDEPQSVEQSAVVASAPPAPATKKFQPPPAKRSMTVPPDQSLADYTRRYAERKLLSMWGVTNTESAGLDFCQGVVRHGLNCLNEASGLPGLYLYDRPAILYLKIGDVSSYAVVLNASPESVVLDVLDREHVIPASALRDVWDGNFLLLWKTTGNIDAYLAQGASGPSVVWLRRAIDKVEGTNTIGTVYDEALVARVRQFQRKVGLAPDGIVGPRTLILLQNKLAEAGS